MEGKIVLLNLGKESYDLVSEIEKLISVLTHSIKRKDLEIRLMKERLEFYEENALDFQSYDTDQLCQRLKCNLSSINVKLSEKSADVKTSSRRKKSSTPMQIERRSRSAPMSRGLTSASLSRLTPVQAWK